MNETIYSGIPSPCLEEAIQLVRGHREGRELDAGFDAGEFSFSAHDLALDDGLTELAGRYDVEIDDLRSAVLWHEMTSDEAAGYGDSQERA